MTDRLTEIRALLANTNEIGEGASRPEMRAAISWACAEIERLRASLASRIELHDAHREIERLDVAVRALKEKLDEETTWKLQHKAEIERLTRERDAIAVASDAIVSHICDLGEHLCAEGGLEGDDEDRCGNCTGCDLDVLLDTFIAARHLGPNAAQQTAERDAAFRAGAEAMQEQAALRAQLFSGDHLRDAIKALPIPESKR